MEAIVGIVAVSAAVTVGVVLLIKHHPSVKGCARGSPDGLVLTDSEGQHYLLTGEIDELKSGDEVRVSGKKTKVSGSLRRFVVEKSKDYGPCPAGATP